VSLREIGWLAVGTPRALPDRSETLVLAAAQRLTDLARIAASERGVVSRDQFLSVASHELKTPLTSIYGLLQLQERMLRPKSGLALTPEQDKQSQFFRILIRQTERLNELIDGLLDVSRIRNGRFLVEPSDADAGEIVRETVANRLAVIARDAGVTLDLDAPEHVPAWIDPVRFEEVVTNLGMNSIRFSPEGGVVRIRLAAGDRGLVLSLRDQGPALPDGDRSRIFQPFEYAQRTTRLGGLGLGLFISRQIAQLHGGNVALVESIPGKGNVFEATFPSRSESRASA
jgi:signal transduction histidine kinase